VSVRTVVVVDFESARIARPLRSAGDFETEAFLPTETVLGFEVLADRDFQAASVAGFESALIAPTASP
jgi:hypothetical protein